MTEEAARNILKKYKRKRFGALVNRGRLGIDCVKGIIYCLLILVSGESWKERLQTLEGIELRQPALAAGSYQNVYLREPE